MGCISKTVTSGALGGYQEVGCLLTNNHIAAMFIFKDPLETSQHNVDMIALSRLADTHKIPYATNPASAVALLSTIKAWGLTRWWAAAGKGSRIETYQAEQARTVANVTGKADVEKNEDEERATLAAKDVMTFCKDTMMCIETLFQQADINGNGRLEAIEVENVLMDLNISVDAHALFACMDKDDNGTVDVRELLQFCARADLEGKS